MIVLGDMWEEVKRDSQTVKHSNGHYATLEEVTFRRFLTSTLEDLQEKKQRLEADLKDCDEVIALFEKENKED